MKQNTWLSVDERITLKLISLIEGVDWINLAQERDQWRALVNIIIINFRVP
jgi:hypothetical protein